jgi:hypothetical protein
MAARARRHTISCQIAERQGSVAHPAKWTAQSGATRPALADAQHIVRLWSVSSTSKGSHLKHGNLSAPRFQSYYGMLGAPRVALPNARVRWAASQSTPCSPSPAAARCSQRPLTRPQAPPITGAGDTGIALQRLVKDNGSHAYFIAALRAGSPAALSVPPRPRPVRARPGRPGRAVCRAGRAAPPA